MPVPTRDSARASAAQPPGAAARPKLGGIDSVGALMRDPYRWIGRQAARLGSEIFETRLLGKRTFCVTGPEAARMFYAPGRFTRQGALPAPVLRVLQDKGSVTTLDDTQHRARKAMFLSLMTDDGLAAAATLLAEELDRAIDRWAARDEIVFDTEIAEVVARAVCRWCGVPLREADAAQRAADLQAMFDGAGSLGPRYLRAAVARARTERWLRQVVRQARRAGRTPKPGSALAVVVDHVGSDGRPLSDEIAMTALANVLRPTVAVGRYLTFATLSLLAHPTLRDELAGARAPSPTSPIDDPTDPFWRFVQEVRRTAPFFPFVAGLVKRPFDWHGHHFPSGVRVVLDLYGTNHDGSAWAAPQTFQPERFADWAGDAARLIPQGAGDPATDHRCAGEWLTIVLMKTGVAHLAQRIAYEVPPQDLSVSMRRVPARPRTGLRMRGVHRPAAQ